MRVLKLLSVVAMVSAAFSATNAMAQTQNVPVSCNWVHASSQSGASAAIVTFQCKEANNNVAATRSLTYSAPTWQVTYCTISLASGVYNSGSCQSASLYRVEPIPPSLCAKAGTYLVNMCANSMVNIPVQSACGSNCSLRYETVGWTSMCPAVGEGRSPEVKVFCQ